MDTSSAPQKILLKALLASGDIDQAHAATASLEELTSRWTTLHDRFEANQYRLTSTQRNRVTAWLRGGLLEALISQLEDLRMSAEVEPLPNSNSDLFDASWWIILSFLYTVTLVLSKSHEELSITAVHTPFMLDDFIQRLINIFSIFKHFASRTPSPTTTQVFHFVESSRSTALQIVQNLLHPEGSSVALKLSRAVYEDAVKFSVLSRNQLLSLVRGREVRFPAGQPIEDVVKTASTLFRHAARAILRYPPDDGDPTPDDELIPFSPITGLEPDTILEDFLTIAEACVGSCQLREYFTVAFMLTLDYSSPMHAAFKKHHFISRSLKYAKSLWGPVGPLDTTISLKAQSGFLAQLLSCWRTHLLQAEDDGVLSECVDGGMIFVLEKIALSDRDQRNSSLYLSVVEVHESMIVNRFFDPHRTRPLDLKLLRQSMIVRQRMQQNRNRDHIIRDIWESFVSRLGGKLYWTGEIGPFCGNHGCESLDNAGLRCVGCRSQYYCSRECQRS
ncbi:hypothetical protein DL93DRAFT_2091374 [Clavulina sp. PMI_390]|nr:hypothetical protein DL93DRAFT_2091374 [Clavulina sp. PMI_390]